jgi:hypothetical protein
LEGLIIDAVMALQRGGRIAVEGGTHFLGDDPEAHLLGMEMALFVGEMVHGI